MSFIFWKKICKILSLSLDTHAKPEFNLNQHQDKLNIYWVQKVFYRRKNGNKLKKNPKRNHALLTNTVFCTLICKLRREHSCWLKSLLSVKTVINEQHIYYMI